MNICYLSFLGPLEGLGDPSILHLVYDLDLEDPSMLSICYLDLGGSFHPAFGCASWIQRLLVSCIWILDLDTGNLLS